jgi:uncharacterized alkaline shock family protein YloU
VIQTKASEAFPNDYESRYDIVCGGCRGNIQNKQVKTSLSIIAKIVINIYAAIVGINTMANFTQIKEIFNSKFSFADPQVVKKCNISL